MARKEAVEYVKTTLGQGFSADEVRKELQSAGWPNEEIGVAFEGAKDPIPSSPEAPKLQIPLHPQPFSQENMVERFIKKTPPPPAGSAPTYQPMNQPPNRKYIAWLIGAAFLLAASGAGAGFWYYFSVM